MVASSEASSEAERLRTALGQLEWDAAGTIIVWSARCRDLFGWTAAEAIGRRFSALGLLSDDEAERSLMALAQAGGARSVTLATGTKSGAEVDCNWFVTAAAGGGCAIIERIPARGRPPLPENVRFRTLVDGAPTAQVFLDLFGRIRYANDAALAMVAGDRTPAYGESYLGFVDERDHEQVARSFRMAAGGNSLEFEMRLRQRSGATIEVTTTMYAVQVGGRIAGVCVLISDPSLLRYTERQLEESRERFRSLFEYHPDSIALVDRGGVIQNCNVALTRKTGFEIEELVGKPLVDVLAMPEQGAPNLVLPSETEVELYLRRKDGPDLPVHVSSVPVVVREEVAGTFLVARDISAQRRAEQALVTQSERLRALYIVAVSAGRSAAQQITETLELGTEMFGMETGFLGEFEGAEFVVRFSTDRNMTHPAAKRLALAQTYVREVEHSTEPLIIDDALRGPRAELAETHQKSRAFVATPIDVFGRRYGAVGFYARLPRPEPFTEPDRDLLRLIGSLCGSALEQAAHDERLDSLAFFDALTGLPNRVLLSERLSKMLATANRRNRRFAVMYVDIDFFKRVNDEHGHVVGDEVLKLVGKRLFEVVRQSDTVARMGGDEFIVLQALNRVGDARKLAQRIRDTLERPMVVGNMHLNVSASVGIAFFPQDADTAAALIGHADEALYRAKADGRNRVEFYGEEPEERSEFEPL